MGPLPLPLIAHVSMSAKSPRNMGGYSTGNERQPSARTQRPCPSASRAWFQPRTRL